MIGRLRLWSGLVLFLFVLGHLFNHVLGIVSLEAMNAGIPVTIEPWRTLPGTILLCGALVTHVVLALWSLYQRRTLRIRRSDAVQLVLGLVIPIVLGGHFFATRGIYETYGAEGGYPFELAGLWIVEPIFGVLNGIGLLVVWVHACIGWHFWFRLKPWYEAVRPFAAALAVLIPALALAGYIAAGFRVLAQSRDQAWLGKMLASTGTEYEVLDSYVFRNQEILVTSTIAIIAAVLVARFIRRWVQARIGGGRLEYRDPWFQRSRELAIRRGHTVLEMLRAGGIAHASVCGGRGRCSTCRVRVGAGAADLAPPTADESRVLKRISAPQSVRLACQIRPLRSLEVTPLLPPTAQALDGYQRPGYLAGEEREVAVLFADIRAFTELAENRLPYDVVFVLNRYFAAMGQAIEEAGGRIDKFIGDGVMALFGLDGGIGDGCRRAVVCAGLMAERLDELNEALAGELHRPLRIGIGIHAGSVIVGEMGYADASHLTAVGDTVNTASRLETLTKTFTAQLVISEDVARLSGFDFDAFPSEDTEIRGRADRLRVRIINSAIELRIDQTDANALPETATPSI